MAHAMGFFVLTKLENHPYKYAIYGQKNVNLVLLAK